MLTLAMECPVLSACPFFADQMQRMPATAELMKLRFCRGQYEQCARWRIRETAGKESVPEDLYPNELARAEELLRSLGR